MYPYIAGRGRVHTGGDVVPSGGVRVTEDEKIFRARPSQLGGRES